MNPCLPYILPQTRQMPHERKRTRKKEKERERKEAAVGWRRENSSPHFVCFLHPLDNHTWLLVSCALTAMTKRSSK